MESTAQRLIDKMLVGNSIRLSVAEREQNASGHTLIWGRSLRIRIREKSSMEWRYESFEYRTTYKLYFRNA